MSVTAQNRNINDLHTTAQVACKLFLAECEKAGVKIFITETRRSQARQNWLYAQGRSRFPGPIVTNTLNSNHKSGLAWDIAVSPPLTLYDTSTMDKAGAIARRLGITWGGDWKGFVDRPHFEVKANWKAPAGNVAHDTPPKEEVIRMFKPSSATLKAAYEQFLSSAIKDGTIAAKWLTDFKANKLSLDDALALKVIVDQRKK
ncbi:M15 family metallopeptidase [Sporosarcina psychrophila]|uniref:Peptidoglycan L-alanyl-D-glutamate endopeptidase CwlK n=1 Tax=Sporosarcina psychrophila TaxID=1476 RepID=A0ABV2KC23_SPOPS